MNRREKGQRKRQIAKRESRKQKYAQISEEEERRQKKKRLSDTYGCIVGLSVLAVFFAYFWIVAVWPRYRAHYLIPIENWHHTNGTMKRVRMGYSSGRNSGWWVTGTYLYQVEGQQFMGNRLGFGLRFNKASAHSFYERLQPSTPVTVFYEKGNPKFSTLYLPRRDDRPGLAFNTILFGAVPLFFLGLTIICIRSSRKLRCELYPRHQH